MFVKLISLNLWIFYLVATVGHALITNKLVRIKHVINGAPLPHEKTNMQCCKYSAHPTWNHSSGTRACDI